MSGKAGEWRGRGERGRPPSVGQKSVTNREVRFPFLAIALRLQSFKSLKTAQRRIQSWSLGGHGPELDLGV